MAWVSGGNSQSGYTAGEIESMTDDALRRVRQMQEKARSYISHPGESNRTDELYLESTETDSDVRIRDSHQNRRHNDDFYKPRRNSVEFSDYSSNRPHFSQVTDPVIKNADDIISLPFLKGLDTDTLILCAIIFVLLQEGADKYLLMALGYILL